MCATRWAPPGSSAFACRRPGNSAGPQRRRPTARRSPVCRAMRLRLGLLLACALAWLLPPVAQPFAAAAANPDVAVEGTQFKVRTSDGRTLRSPELVGAILSIAAGDRTLQI